MANGTLKVSNIQTSSGSGTITLGQSGETVSVPSGATLDMSSGTMTLNSSMKATPAFHAVRTSSQSISTNTNTKVQFDTEDFDTDNCYDNSTNYRFTPGVSGKYYLYAGVRPNQTDDFNESQIYIRKNGSDVALATKRNTYSDTVHCYTTVASDTDDYFEVFYYHTRGSSLNLSGNSNSYTYFGGYKLIGT